MIHTPDIEAVAKLLMNHTDISIAQSVFKQAQSASRQGTWTFFGTFCKNCWFGGKGLVHHRMSDCRKGGMQCFVPCSRCDGQKHWAEDCPKKFAFGQGQAFSFPCHRSHCSKISICVRHCFPVLYGLSCPKTWMGGRTTSTAGPGCAGQARQR